MKQEIMPAYLPAAAVTFTPKDGGEPVTVYRPFEAFPLPELEQHAQENERGALFELGKRYFFGRLGAEQDDEKAYGYLLKASELGVQDAMALLAAYYLNGRLMEPDPEKCRAWLEKAAENGSWDAMLKLADFYRTGDAGFPVDHEAAYEWALQAERMVRIYWAYYAQDGFVDFAQKQKALLAAHTRAAFFLADCFADGIGVKRDLNEAIRWINTGEQFVCGCTGLAKAEMFTIRRAQLRQRVKNDEQRRRNAARAAKKKKK